MSDPTTKQLEEILNELIESVEELTFNELIESMEESTFNPVSPYERIRLQTNYRDEATQAIQSLINEARANERQEVALDNYKGQTFSSSTNYKGKWDKFVRNNEAVIKQLTEETK
jgi:hypothetical protein